MRILRRTCTAFANGFGRTFRCSVKNGRSVRSLLDVSVAAVLTAFVPAYAMAGVSPSATIAGAVTLTAADGSTWAGDGARVALACGADRTTRTEVADEHGAFRFVNVPIGSCSIKADVQGFGTQPITVITAAQQVIGVELHLGIAPLRVGVNVGGTGHFQEPKTLPRSSRSHTGPRHSTKRCKR